MSGLDTQDQILIEQIVANEAPSAGVAYVLAILLGLFSGHRFYLRRPGTAVLQILSYFVVVGFFWWIVDLFLIPGMVREAKEKIRQREMLKMLTRARPDAAAIAKSPQVSPELLDKILAGESGA